MSHARLSASASSQWMGCPGSIQLIRQLEAAGHIPPDTASDAAMEGTAAHHVAEQCLRDLVHGEWGVSADKYQGYVVDVEIQGDGTEHYWAEDKSTLPEPRKGWRRYTVDDDMILAINVFINHVQEILESLGASDEGIPPDVEVEIEAYADLSFLGRDDLGGRIDVRITQLMGEMHVIDYKHGRGIPVSPEENSQLMIYGLGGECNTDVMPESVHLTIVQPRCPKNAAVESWAISTDELLAWGRGILLPAAEATALPDAAFNPGEKQCMWCRAAGHCDAAHDRALVVAAEEFPDDLEPTEENAKKAVLAMDMDKVLQIMAMRGFVEGAIKAATARVMAELEAGREVDGWKLVEGKANRKWKNNAEETLKQKRVPATIMYTKKLASFTSIEKAKKGKWKKLVLELTEKPAGKATLVPESDKRKALSPSAQTDFDELPPEEDLLS